ncbi:MAG: glycosyltransferase [Alphaproteobacteria bacterium]|nr:glycosyltransferase [Alphaproteobacteria bacterium]
MPIPQLTAVICFANEGDEVEQTVRGIRDTSGDNVDILLINDASDDGRDYESVADRFGCRYFLNSDRIGPAHCRQKGVRWAKTENVILLDAHMRFYAKDWHQSVNAAIAEDPNALYCTRSRPLAGGGIYEGGPIGHGASVTRREETFGASLKSKWNIRSLGESGTSYIPCLLGGNYAMQRDFMEHIGSYRGLHRYGCEEPLISIKAWLAGGSCKLINDIEIGHIYRGSEGAPWTEGNKFQHFNKLATARILMEDNEFNLYSTLVNSLSNAGNVRNVYESRKMLVMQARKQFQASRKLPLSYFWDLNAAFLRGETIAP